MTESILYQKYIKKYLDSIGCMYYRVEHPRLPDIYTCKNGISTWYELKVINIPCSSVLVPDWRPGQLAWIHDVENKGGGKGVVVLILWYNNVIKLLEPQESYTLGEWISGRSI